MTGHKLSPRLRTTLDCHLDGMSRKQIAYHLDLSENTISGYVRDVHKFYKVQSHAQLMMRFRDGDSGDR